jgi:hypothetical protein
MKSKSITVLVALVAVFAISAVATSSALASPEWYVKKSGVFAKVTTSVKVTMGSSKIEVIDTKRTNAFKVPFGMSCTVLEGIGVIKSAGAGEVSSFKVPVKDCTGVKREGRQYCEKVTNVEANGLSWKTELYSEGSEVRERLVPSSEAGLRFECETSLGSLSDDCSSNTSFHISNNALLGLAEATFDAKTSKTQCSLGGKEAGEWAGGFTTKANEAGVEAIKAE